MVAEREHVPCYGSCDICSRERCCLGSGKSNDLAFSCPSVSASFDRRQTTTWVIDSSACEEADLVSVGGDSHVNNATCEKFDLWNTGRFSFVPIPKDIQLESMPKLLVTGNVVPYGGQKCASSILQNVQISGILDDGHEVLVGGDPLDGAAPVGISFDGGEFKTVDVSVVRQGQVPTVQAVQKTVEVPQVQFLDRVVDVPLVMQRQVPCPSMPRERIQERIWEETIDISIPQMTEETIEGVKSFPQELVQNDAVVHIVDVPVPWIREETGQVTQLIPQDRISDRNVEQTVENLVWQIQEQTVEVINVAPEERVQPHRRVFIMNDCDELIPE